MSNNEYIPCEICGENRATQYCHIIPRSEGGPSHEENYIYLCPTHHHLFDQSRLSKEEWGSIDYSKKLEAARKYMNEVKLPILQFFWNKQITDDK